MYSYIINLGLCYKYYPMFSGRSNWFLLHCETGSLFLEARCPDVDYVYMARCCSTQLTLVLNVWGKRNQLCPSGAQSPLCRLRTLSSGLSVPYSSACRKSYMHKCMPARSTEPQICIHLLHSHFCIFLLKVQQFSEKSFLLELLKTHENALERQRSEIISERDTLLQARVSLQPPRNISVST